MNSFPHELESLIEMLACFPGVGRRSAERIAFYILKMSDREVDTLAKKILQVHKSIRPCKFCNNFSIKEVCSICSNPKRRKDIICIVEEPKDVIAIEKTSQYDGLYYVLLGAIAPLEGVGPENLSIKKLLNRLRSGEIKEVIISTDPDNEGELTAQFLIEKVSHFGVKLYRIGIGIPFGTQIEYIDSATLGRAISERKLIET
ncbi:MAG: recombination protein RecR [Candidatus Omnitrophica bacterium]|nr:recombination protein RecR [Candidatus Omnitrophota bacterium]